LELSAVLTLSDSCVDRWSVRLWESKCLLLARRAWLWNISKAKQTNS